MNIGPRSYGIIASAPAAETGREAPRRERSRGRLLWPAGEEPAFRCLPKRQPEALEPFSIFARPPASPRKPSSQAHRPRTIDHQRHQEKSNHRHIFAEVHLLVHPAHGVRDQPERVNLEGDTEKKKNQKPRANRGMVAQQKTQAAEQQQYARALHRQFWRRRALAFGIARHHAGMGEVVESRHKEVSAHDNAPDEKEYVEGLHPVHCTTSFVAVAAGARRRDSRAAARRAFYSTPQRLPHEVVAARVAPRIMRETRCCLSVIG